MQKSYSVRVSTRTSFRRLKLFALCAMDGTAPMAKDVADNAWSESGSWDRMSDLSDSYERLWMMRAEGFSPGMGPSPIDPTDCYPDCFCLDPTAPRLPPGHFAMRPAKEPAPPVFCESCEMWLPPGLAPGASSAENSDGPPSASPETERAAKGPPQQLAPAPGLAPVAPAATAPQGTAPVVKAATAPQGLAPVAPTATAPQGTAPVVKAATAPQGLAPVAPTATAQLPAQPARPPPRPWETQTLKDYLDGLPRDTFWNYALAKKPVYSDVCTRPKPAYSKPPPPLPAWADQVLAVHGRATVPGAGQSEAQWREAAWLAVSQFEADDYAQITKMCPRLSEGFFMGAGGANGTFLPWTPRYLCGSNGGCCIAHAGASKGSFCNGCEGNQPRRFGASKLCFWCTIATARIEVESLCRCPAARQIAMDSLPLVFARGREHKYPEVWHWIGGDSFETLCLKLTAPSAWPGVQLLAPAAGPAPVVPPPPQVGRAPVLPAAPQLAAAPALPAAQQADAGGMQETLRLNVPTPDVCLEESNVEAQAGVVYSTVQYSTVQYSTVQ